MKKLSVVIPVYNEMATLDAILAKVQAAPLPDGLAMEVVLVDDCSTDGSRAKLEALQTEHPEWIVCFHEVNQGKGAALRDGFAAATGDIVLIQDADLETSLKGDFAKFVLANSITLTPGTVTIRIYKDNFIIHAISKKAAGDLEGTKSMSEMERRVAWVFEKELCS